MQAPANLNLDQGTIRTLEQAGILRSDWRTRLEMRLERNERIRARFAELRAGGMKSHTAIEQIAGEVHLGIKLVESIVYPPG